MKHSNLRRRLAFGTVLGAYLSKAGVDVDLITRNKEHVDAMNKGKEKLSAQST